MTWQEDFDMKFWHLRPTEAKEQVKEFIEKLLSEKESWYQETVRNLTRGDK